MDMNQLGILLLGIVLGWFLLFAVRRYRVQWGAFALFMSLLFGLGILGFLYMRDLLAYYGVGVFIGFFGNLVVRAIGTAVGGRVGQGLLEISTMPGGGEREDELRKGQGS
jgi:hypothetical protein